MKTNSLSSFVPAVHSRKEQAALLKGEKNKSNNTKSYYKLPKRLKVPWWKVNFPAQRYP